MIRGLLCIIFIVITLNVFSFDAQFKDGLHLSSVGWPERIVNWWKGRK